MTEKKLNIICYTQNELVKLLYLKHQIRIEKFNSLLLTIAAVTYNKSENGRMIKDLFGKNKIIKTVLEESMAKSLQSVEISQL